MLQPSSHKDIQAPLPRLDQGTVIVLIKLHHYHNYFHSFCAQLEADVKRFYTRSSSEGNALTLAVMCEFLCVYHIHTLWLCDNPCTHTYSMFCTHVVRTSCTAACTVELPLTTMFHVFHVFFRSFFPWNPCFSGVLCLKWCPASIYDPCTILSTFSNPSPIFLPLSIFGGRYRKGLADDQFLLTWGSWISLSSLGFGRVSIRV